MKNFWQFFLLAMTCFVVMAGCGRFTGYAAARTYCVRLCTYNRSWPQVPPRSRLLLLEPN